MSVLLYSPGARGATRVCRRATCSLDTEAGSTGGSEAVGLDDLVRGAPPRACAAAGIERAVAAVYEGGV